MKQTFGLGIALGIGGTILLGILVWLTVVYGGLYNVAASDPHEDAVRWSLATTMRQSVAGRAGESDLPSTPSEALLAQGAGHYSESCAICHGGPGQEPEHWTRSMRPEPPHLVEAASEWSPGELH